MLLDLRPYGIDVILDSKNAGLPKIEVKNVQSCKVKDSTITVKAKKYTIKDSIANGTFGSVFKATSDDYGDVVVKLIHIETMTEFQDFVKEAIIQILLQETSKDQPDGPYVPEVYDIFYDRDKGDAYLVTQAMLRTLHDFVDLFATTEKDKGVSAKDIIIPMFFIDIAKILQFFQRTLEFNHRDMKGNNIMYIKNASQKRIVKLIDFGFSCLKWGNMSIRGGDYFKASTTCFRRERDMSQLMVYALQYFPPISSLLRQYLIEMLKAEVKGEPCSVGEGCMYHGKLLVKDYMNAYNFYNRANVVSPFASPNTVIAHMERFEKKLPFNSSVRGVAGSGTGAATTSDSAFINIAHTAAGAVKIERGTGAPPNSGSVFIDIAPLAAKAGAGVRGGTRRRTQNKRHKRTRYHKK